MVVVCVCVAEFKAISLSAHLPPPAPSLAIFQEMRKSQQEMPEPFVKEEETQKDTFGMFGKVARK